MLGMLFVSDWLVDAGCADAWISLLVIIALAIVHSDY